MKIRKAVIPAAGLTVIGAEAGLLALDRGDRRERLGLTGDPIS